MRTLAAGALALVAGGCLKAEAIRCDNGAICKDDQACTEWPVCRDTSCEIKPLCGPADLVSQCADDAKAFSTCDVTSPSDGTCVDRICTKCTPELAGCGSTTTWEAMTAPDGTPALKSVWIDTRTHAFAGGASGTLLEYDGRSWQRSASFPSTSDNLIRIFGTGPDDVYVIATGAQVFHFDGTSWRNIMSDFPAGTGVIKAIHGASKSDMFAAGFGGTLLHFNGAAWTLLSGSGGPALAGVTETANGALAVGTAGYLMEYDGATVTTGQLPSPFMNPDLVDVFRKGDKVLVAGPTPMTGTTNTLLEREAGTWKQSASVPAQFAVFCAADDYVCSDGGHIYHYDGTQWVVTPTGPSPTSLRGISARDGYVIAVGDGAAIWRMRTN